MYAITKANVEALLDSGDLYAGMRNGAWWKLRRNGATKRWKRDANRIYIPIKAGFKSYSNLTETDFMSDGGTLNPDMFRHADDIPAKTKR